MSSSEKKCKRGIKFIEASFHNYVQKWLEKRDPIQFVVNHDPKSCGVNPKWKENGGIINVSKFKARFTEAEIAKNGRYSYFYARLTGRHFELGEPMIAKDVESSYLYSRYILRHPFPLAEGLLAKHADWSYYYARDVIRRPFELGEPAIARDHHWAFLYALNVLLLSYAEALVWGKKYLKEYDIELPEDEENI